MELYVSERKENKVKYKTIIMSEATEEKEDDDLLAAFVARTIPAVKPIKRIIIEVGDIYVPQNAKCPLWDACITKRCTFEEAADRCNNDFDRMIGIGLNRNFMTRDRWFDINTLTKKMGIDGPTLIGVMDIDRSQFFMWNLSPQELDQLRMTPIWVATKYGFKVEPHPIAPPLPPVPDPLHDVERVGVEFLHSRYNMVPVAAVPSHASLSIYEDSIVDSDLDLDFQV